MPYFKEAFVVLVMFVLGLKMYLNVRQTNAIKNNSETVPENFARSVSLSDHQKAAAYNIAKLSVMQVEDAVATLLAIFMTLGGGIQLINNQITLHNPLFAGIAVIGIYSLISMLVALPFNLYNTFKIEQKFGFNNTTIKLFISDLIKGLLISVIIGAPILYLVLWCMQIMGSTWWVWVFALLVIFNLLLLVIYPTIIAPLFNKFKPLADEDLKVALNQLLATCGFKSKGIFVMDGSKRSSHGNAYFTGIGKAKRIVFFDTLLKQLNHNEIKAVLAHELGHFKMKHILKQMLFMFAVSFIILFILSKLIGLPQFYTELGVSTISSYNALLLFSIIIGQISFLFAPIASLMSRKNEFEADSYAVSKANRQDLISGLTKLYRDNAATLTPDDIYVKFYYSHPPASIRIQKIEELNA